MLSVKNLFCGYDGTDVVKKVSFDIPAGRNLCIAGPNGCGKTTLLRAVCGLIPHRGTISFDGTEISRMSRRQIAENMALLSQISSVYFSYTVYETVMMGRYRHMSRILPGSSAEDRDFVLACLEDVGLADLRGRQIASLSGGQLQRVFLARTFAQDPHLILLDEPTNHLDLKYQLELVAYLREWSRSRRRAVIGVLHNLNLTLDFADDVLLLKDGAAAALAPADALLDGELLRRVFGIDVKKYMLASLEKWKR